MIGRREADAVRVAESPRHGLDGVLRIRDFGTQDRARAHARARRVFERLHDRARRGHAMVGVAAGHVVYWVTWATDARFPDVLAERDLLARDFVLVAAAAVIVAGDARIRRGALRPIEPAVL